MLVQPFSIAPLVMQPAYVLVSYQWVGMRMSRGHTHHAVRELRSQAQALRLSRHCGHEDGPRNSLEYSFHFVRPR